MLRLNMAVPPTPRNSADFSSEGLLAAAVLGLTDAALTTAPSTRARCSSSRTWTASPTVAAWRMT
ncbi:MAG: hypothetical protein WKG07_16495 [Hymenobacter sp.]